MNDDFNWLEYAEPLAEAPPAPRPSALQRLRARFGWLRLPGGISRLRLPKLRRRGGQNADAGYALLEARDERPISQLDARLLALRERAEPAINAEAALSTVDELLTTPPLQEKPGGLISAAALSQAQRQQVQMLQDIVGAPAPAAASGEPARLGALPGLTLGGAPRLLLAVSMLLAVCLPFVASEYVVGELPPSDFGGDRADAAAAFEQLNTLTGTDYVLVALEYGPTSAGELDQLTDLFLRQIFAQRAKPLIVSSNPIAIAHAQNIIKRINRSVAAAGLKLVNNADYFLLRYLPGGALGTRELRENFADVARVSARGELINRNFKALTDMKLLLLVAESIDVMRNWVEQVLPASQRLTLLAATGYAAQPLAQAYADSQERIIGIIAGARDAYTYAEKLEAAYSTFKPEGALQAPLPQPTAPPLTPAPESEIEAPALIATVASPVPAAATASPTPLASPTVPSIPSVTPPPTASPTPPPSPTPEPVWLVEVTAEDTARIRRGPTTVDDILQLAYAGDTFEVIGTNGDGSWYNILLSPRINGWIAAFLVEERYETGGATAADASASLPREQSLLRWDYRASLGKNQPRLYQVSPTDTGIDWEYVLLRDRSLEAPRLAALSLGTLAAALIIVIGSVLGALRAIGGRRQPPASEAKS